MCIRMLKYSVMGKMYKFKEKRHEQILRHRKEDMRQLKIVRRTTCSQKFGQQHQEQAMKWRAYIIRFLVLCPRCILLISLLLRKANGLISVPVVYGVRYYSVVVIKGSEQDRWGCRKHNYWCSGPCPSSGIKREKGFSGSVLSSREGRMTPTPLGLLEWANRNHWWSLVQWLRLALSKGSTEYISASLHLGSQTDPFSVMLFYTFYSGR
jgi:hypothetical protein